MKKFRLDLELFFQRQLNRDEDATMAWERMAREIKGSIFTLIALFELIALTSYIPIDSFNLFSGRLDHINNMGGIVGAALSEWFLGTVGVAGYSVILLTVWLAFSSFRGGAFKDSIFRILGTILGAVLLAITFHLLMTDRFPEASLMQGGVVGRFVGGALKRYLNTTGALLVVGGGFVVTFILTTGISITGMVQSLFAETNEEDAELEKSTPAPRPRPQLAVARPAPAPQSDSKKRARKKAAAKGISDGLSSSDEKTAEINLSASTEFVDDEKTEELDLAQAQAALPYQFEEMIPFEGSYQLPTLRLLKGADSVKRLSKGELKENAKKLCEHLLSFQITGEVTHITQGPVVITYEFKPSAGIKLSKIAGLQDDLGIVLGTRELRIIAPIPGKTVVGIEVPRPEQETIALKDVLAEDAFFDKKNKIPVALGKSTDGVAVFGDLAGMPHLLVAGATGSGKSVFVNSLIMSFLFRLTPQQLRLILVDPKMLELSVFDGIPHLITNVITNNNVALSALSWAVDEMERRYKLMSETGSKNIESYNSKQKSSNAKLPFIVIVVDELADLMMSGGELAEVSITRLAQKARAAGIHLVIATQRPSTDVVTGLIKANIPSRLSFKVPSAIDSRTVLDTGGAEELIGRGDSLMVRPAVPLQRLHGTFVTEDELARVVKFVKGGKDHSKNYIQFSATQPAKD